MPKARSQSCSGGAASGPWRGQLALNWRSRTPGVPRQLAQKDARPAARCAARSQPTPGFPSIRPALLSAQPPKFFPAAPPVIHHEVHHLALVRRRKNRMPHCWRSTFHRQGKGIDPEEIMLVARSEGSIAPSALFFVRSRPGRLSWTGDALPM